MTAINAFTIQALYLRSQIVFSAYREMYDEMFFVSVMTFEQADVRYVSNLCRSVVIRFITANPCKLLRFKLFIGLFSKGGYFFFHRLNLLLLIRLLFLGRI